MKSSGITFTTIAAILIFVFANSALVKAQSGGTIEGIIYDGDTEEVLPGANVSLEGTTQGATSGQDGRFVLRNIPEGDYLLIISFVGYESQEIEIEVDDEIEIDEYDVDVDIDEVAEIEIRLEPSSEMLDEIAVTSYRRGQQRALAEQKGASNIINVIDEELIAAFPDPNVGESLKRIPGISIQNDQGEARYIQIRGTSPTLSNVSINGEQVASPEGDERSVTLDMIPSDLLGSIEVTKAITPDMDGDAVGGSVNLKTKSAVSEEQVLRITADGGYHNNVSRLSPFGGRLSANYGQRIGDDGAFGYMIGANYNRTNIGTDNNEMEYDEGELETLEMRDYELTRERFGLTSNFDYKFSNNSKIYFNGSYNYFGDDQIRGINLIEVEEIAREFSHRLEENRIISTSLGGEHGLGNGFDIDYRASYSYSDQRKPFDREVIYAQGYEDQAGDEIEIISFDQTDPNFPQFSVTEAAPASAGAYNYDAYEFDEYVDASESTSDQHFTTRLNLSKEYTFSNNVSGKLKFGGSARFKSKDQDVTENVYDYDGGIGYSNLLDDFEDSNYLLGNYPDGLGLFPNQETLKNFFEDNQSDFELEGDDTQEASNAEDYDATEDTYAGYVMTNLQLGDLGTVIGVRYEHLETAYNGHVAEYDDNEDLSISTSSDKNNFDFWLPMIHLKYDIQDKANLRLAWTNTFSRPNYFALVPYRVISRPDEEIELGNPDLTPARAMNLDFMAEYYLSSIGIISAGVFFKQIDNFIYTANFEFDEAPYVGYEATQPINGEDADLAGFEVAIQNQLTFLPGFAEGFGVFANYTYTWSEARLLTEDGDFRTVQLPGQATDVANLAISYEKYGFSGRISLNYSGAFIAEIRESSDSDRYYDSSTQIDLSMSQQISPTVRIFADVINLTNEPLRYYNGVKTRPEQQEYYSWRGKLGVKLNF